MFTLATLNVTLQLEYPGIVGQTPACNFQFSQRAVIIEVSSIKIFCPRQMRLACVRLETKSRLDGCFRQRQARRSMIMANDIKEIMDPDELAIGLEK